jgi:hypothetical protein
MTPEDAINQMHVDVGIKKDWRKYAKGSNWILFEPSL